MKKILFVCFCAIFLNADIYYAKLEPLENYSIKSEVSGKVVFSNIQRESFEVKNEKIVQIDDYIDTVELKSLSKKINLLKETKEILKEQIKNEEAVLKIKEENFLALKKLTTKSKVQKDSEYFALINSKNQLLNLKNQLISTDIQLNDLEFKIESLKDRIQDKKIIVSGFVNKIFVKEGDFVNAGSLLVDVFDVSKGKLEIFVSNDDIRNISSKTILINDKDLNIKPSKIYKVADSERVSTYKVEFILDRSDIFSELVKVEIR